MNLLSTLNDAESVLNRSAAGLARSRWLIPVASAPVTCALTPASIAMAATCVGISDSPTQEELDTPEQEDPCVNEDPPETIAS